MPLRIGVIVEGHGEDGSVRRLLERIWFELLAGDALDVLRPFRQPQGTLLKKEGLQAAVRAVKIKLDQRPPDEFHKLVLILIDSEGTCPKELAPQLLAWAREARSDAEIACVLPHWMFETWFAAAAASLAGVNGLPAEMTAPEDAERNGLGKGWLKKQLPRKYSETVDQPRFTARMDLKLCRERSSSFDKLCSELERRLPGASNPPAPSMPTAEAPEAEST